MSRAITEYLDTVRAALAVVDVSSIEAVTECLFEAYLQGRTVYTMGNGASAALASHMACDLGKGTARDLALGPGQRSTRRLRIICLNDNIALLTAYSNDIAYEDVFVEQLKNLLRPDDVVIGVSGSGGSPNVLRAMEYARLAGATTVGFTGNQPSAEQMRLRADLMIEAPLDLMEQIEDLHVVFHHIVTIGLRSRIMVDQAMPHVRLIEPAGATDSAVAFVQNDADQ